MTSSSLFTSIFLAALNAVNVVKAAQTITVCSAGECITGQSNITRLGAALNTQSNAYLLLPGQYAANVQPTSLSQALTSATATVTFTTGFSNSTTATSPSLPLNVALQPGLLNYPSDLYTGDPSFIPLPQSINSTFNPTSINRGSIILAANTVAAIEADNNGVKNRVVLWDTVPFISQLPYTMAGNLRILSLLSSSCSPACSNNVAKNAPRVSLVLSAHLAPAGAENAMRGSTDLEHVLPPNYLQTRRVTAIARALATPAVRAAEARLPSVSLAGTINSPLRGLAFPHARATCSRLTALASLVTLIALPAVDLASTNGTTSGLGVCLAQELVQVPNNSGTPPVAIPPIDPNAQQPSSGGGKKLLWWQILLIVLGALLLLVLILICWRRRARQKRAKETEQFKHNLKHQGLWAKLWRNPFAAWWARRRSAALARRSQDVEQMSYAKDWKSNSSSADRRTAVGVPKSISRGSWVTMGQHTERRGSFDGRSYFTNNAGLGVIREDRRHDDQWERAREPSERSYGRSYKNGASSYSDGESRRYREPPRGESQYYGQEIEQEDVRSERTYDPYQYPRPSSRTSDDLVSMIKSEYTEGDRYDDRLYNQARNHPRDNRSLRQDYPQSVTTRRTQSRHYQYDDARSYGRKTRGESPSMYSQSTGFPPPHSRQMPPIAFPEEPVRDAVLSSRFSMSTTAASTHPPSKNLRKSPPAEPVPQLTEPPRQLTDAEMYKMSKLFPELLKLVSPTKKEHSPQQTTNPSPSRNPFRTFI
ncbi:hypothetical protein FRC17_007949 [Serendipita sp. 399]|nr:hypothetical protein FRC17_007949 [Serendipita sp. 399]